MSGFEDEEKLLRLQSKNEFTADLYDKKRFVRELTLEFTSRRKRNPVKEAFKVLDEIEAEFSRSG